MGPDQRGGLEGGGGNAGSQGDNDLRDSAGSGAIDHLILA